MTDDEADAYYNKWLTAKAKVRKLEDLVRRAQAIVDPCYPSSHHEWQKEASELVGPRRP